MYRSSCGLNRDYIYKKLEEQLGNDDFILDISGAFLFKTAPPQSHSKVI
jgi:hypothetical protein